MKKNILILINVILIISLLSACGTSSGDKLGNSNGNIVAGGVFALSDDNKIYYSQGYSYLVKVNGDTEEAIRTALQKEPLLSNEHLSEFDMDGKEQYVLSLNVINEDIYFAYGNKILKYNEKAKKIEKMFEGENYIYNMFIIGKKAYFKQRSKEDNKSYIYTCTLKDEKATKISTIPVGLFNIYKDNIYYLQGTDDNETRKEIRKISLKDNKDELFYTTKDTKDFIMHMLVSDGHIYYSQGADRFLNDLEIFKIKLDGTEKTQLTQHDNGKLSISHFNISGDTIHAHLTGDSTWEQGTDIITLKTDGTGITPLMNAETGNGYTGNMEGYILGERVFYEAAHYKRFVQIK